MKQPIRKTISRRVFCSNRSSHSNCTRTEERQHDIKETYSTQGDDPLYSTPHTSSTDPVQFPQGVAICRIEIHPLKDRKKSCSCAVRCENANEVGCKGFYPQILDPAIAIAIFSHPLKINTDGKEKER